MEWNRYIEYDRIESSASGHLCAFKVVDALWKLGCCCPTLCGFSVCALQGRWDFWKVKSLVSSLCTNSMWIPSNPFSCFVQDLPRQYQSSATLLAIVWSEHRFSKASRISSDTDHWAECHTGRGRGLEITKKREVSRLVKSTKITAAIRRYQMLQYVLEWFRIHSNDITSYNKLW
jgi:hypothetical protein